MSTPTVYGGLGLASHGLGRLGLGGPQPPQSYAPPTMAKTGLAYIAHLYDHNLTFKRTLGGASILTKPGLKLTQNGGYQPITLEVAAPILGAAPSGPDSDVVSFSGAVSNASAVLASFKPQTGQIIRQVGALGAFLRVAVGTITPAFGQATTAGNTLYAFVTCNKSIATAPITTTAPGWVLDNAIDKGGVTQSSIWHKSNCGASETAPTFTAGASTIMEAALGEFSKVATTSPLDQTGTFVDTNSPLSPKAAAADAQAGDLVLVASCWHNTVALTGTFTHSANYTDAGNNGAFSSPHHSAFAFRIMPQGGGSVVLGDVIRLSEQGDSAGTILFSGNVETTPEEIGPAGTHHQLAVTPWVAELGDAPFNQTYSIATDVAQFVRDAVAQTAHLSVTPISCPNTGVTAIYDFQNTNALDAVHVAKQIAGGKFFYFVDSQGVVWFQQVNTSNPATITLKKGVDYDKRKTSTTIVGMRNKIVVIGGQPAGSANRITSTYNGVTNQGIYGVRAWNPTPSYPNVTDQTTLDAIAASLGAQFDRALTTIEIELPALGKRLTPARAGGLTVRLWEPASEPYPEAGAGLYAGYSAVYVLQDVEANGATQLVRLGDIPFSEIDTTYEANRIAQRIGVIAAAATPIPALAPPAATPASIVNLGLCSSGHTTYAIGGGIVTIATATFTTNKAGTVQVQGAIDARVIAWDNYIAVPRRSVRAVLSGGIYTGAWQELPFGLQRATYDLSSASGISLPAGTYTLSIQIDTQEYNQMEVFSSWAQSAVTA